MNSVTDKLKTVEPNFFRLRMDVDVEMRDIEKEWNTVWDNLIYHQNLFEQQVYFMINDSLLYLTPTTR